MQGVNIDEKLIREIHSAGVRDGIYGPPRTWKLVRETSPRTYVGGGAPADAAIYCDLDTPERRILVGLVFGVDSINPGVYFYRPIGVHAFHELLRLVKPEGGGARLSDYDCEHVGEIIEHPSDYTNFSAHLLRLIKKADTFQREVLRVVYPDHVEALIAWEAAPNQPPRPPSPPPADVPFDAAEAMGSALATEAEPSD